jgi:MFS family permease
VRLGLRENAAQFALLVVVNGLVGATIGSERSVLPLLARDELGLASTVSALGFLVAFGLAKAVANLIAGAAAGRVGRRRVLMLGWIAALPVPALLFWAASWHWLVLANLLLGVNQGLAWSATVIMKIDLAGPRQRGLAMGLNEFAGYVAVAGAALAAGYIAGRTDARAALAMCTGASVLLGFALTLAFVRDTTDHVHAEAAEAGAGPVPVGRAATRSLAWANQAGLVSPPRASGPSPSDGWPASIPWSGESHRSAPGRSPIGSDGVPSSRAACSSRRSRSSSSRRRRASRRGRSRRRCSASAPPRSTRRCWRR